ncbi:MAG: hypothetical protein IJJ34_07240, partial [Clostridia bacterium]|nr:hypothetical protein [Clostridia bacterium]
GLLHNKHMFSLKRVYRKAGHKGRAEQKTGNRSQQKDRTTKQETTRQSTNPKEKEEEAFLPTLRS